MLLAFGIGTMIPAPDYGPWGADPGLDVKRLSAALAMPLGAFIRVNPGGLETAVAFAADPFAAPLPSLPGIESAPAHFANTLANVDHPALGRIFDYCADADCGTRPVTCDLYRVMEF